jgi:uncharacterized membrane protein
MEENDMQLMILGILLFFGMHSVSILAIGFRDRQAENHPLGWKAVYSIVSLVGLILISKGYADLRQSATLLYVSPDWLRHVSAMLLLPTFILFLAPYFPGQIKNTLKHPQLIAVMIWAVAHLLVNGTPGDALLFGSFLVWAVTDWVSMNSRETRPVPGARSSSYNDMLLITLGLVFYAVVAFWFHEMLFGMRPFP